MYSVVVNNNDNRSQSTFGTLCKYMSNIVQLHVYQFCSVTVSNVASIWTFAKIIQSFKGRTSFYGFTSCATLLTVTVDINICLNQYNDVLLYIPENKFNNMLLFGFTNLRNYVPFNSFDFFLVLAAKWLLSDFHGALCFRIKRRWRMFCCNILSARQKSSRINGKYNTFQRLQWKL